MVQSLLSLLVMGMVPAAGVSSHQQTALEGVDIAPPSEAFHMEQRLSASGVLILDAESGQPVFERDAADRRPMASLTKLMTAILVVENHDLDEIVVIPEGIEDVVGNKAYLSPGQRFTVGELLSALLITSANDAAITLAQYHSGSVSAFVEAMNDRAQTLGLKDTSFTNPVGLDNPLHQSTARDIAWLTLYALRQPVIAERMASPGRIITSTEGETIRLYHTHALLHRESDVVAGKTGTTTDARQCLVSLVEGKERDYLVVLLGSNQRYEDMKSVLAVLSEHDPSGNALAIGPSQWEDRAGIARFATAEGGE